MTDFAFAPAVGTTKSITAASTTSAVALSLMDVEPSHRTVRVYNSTGVIVFIEFGTSAVTALTTGLPIPPGAVETFEVPGVHTHVAGITASGGGTVYFTEGLGNS